MQLSQESLNNSLLLAGLLNDCKIIAVSKNFQFSIRHFVSLSYEEKLDEKGNGTNEFGHILRLSDGSENVLSEAEYNMLWPTIKAHIKATHTLFSVVNSLVPEEVLQAESNNN